MKIAKNYVETICVDVKYGNDLLVMLDFVIID